MPHSNRRLSQFLSIRQLAEKLEVSTRSVHRYIAGGDLHVHRIGRQVRISEDDAIAFTASRRQ